MPGYKKVSCLPSSFSSSTSIYSYYLPLTQLSGCLKHLFLQRERVLLLLFYSFLFCLQSNHFRQYYKVVAYTRSTVDVIRRSSTSRSNSSKTEDTYIAEFKSEDFLITLFLFFRENESGLTHFCGDLGYGCDGFD